MGLGNLQAPAQGKSDHQAKDLKLGSPCLILNSSFTPHKAEISCYLKIQAHKYHTSEI